MWASRIPGVSSELRLLLPQVASPVLGTGHQARVGATQEATAQAHLDVWDAVQVQGAQDVEHTAALVILGKTWCVDGGPNLVYNLPERALKGRGSRGWRETRD